MKPKINLCVYNHDRHSILDQIWFAREIFSQNGYEPICTDTLRPDCLNLLIENFVERDADTLEGFCRKYDKQIGIVMTEHIERGPHGFSFDGAPLEDADYIGNKAQRLFSLLSLDECVFGYFTLGELPELKTWNEILPGRRVCRLPYPSIRKQIRIPSKQDFDLVFTGQSTAHRDGILNEIAKKHRLLRSDIGKTEKERSSLYARAKIAINIPQSADWRWVSPMRVLFGLRAGIPTVHLGLRDETMFSKLVLEPVELDRALSDPDRLFQRQIGAYESLVQSEHNFRFPAGFFKAWAEIEGLK